MPCVLIAAAFVVGGLTVAPIFALPAYAIIFIGFNATAGPSWAIASSFLTGKSAAAGIATANTIAIVGGFLGPYWMGRAKDFTGNYQTGLLTLAIPAFAGAAIVLFMRRGRRVGQASACLILTFVKLPEVKTRQAEACPTAAKRGFMPEKVDLYNTAYGNSEVDVYSEVRHETYGLDLGQTSWVSEEELAEIPRLLQISAASNVLEIGCGAGGCALHFGATVGCRVTGIDVNAHGIRAAEHSAHAQQLAARVHFIQHDAGARLPFPHDTFDAAYSNDAFCHIPDRLHLLRECRRVLKPGGRLLFSDALVVNGPLTNEEIAARSSIGYYVFMPRGENERLIQEAGLTFLQAQDSIATGSRCFATMARRARPAKGRVAKNRRRRRTLRGYSGFSDASTH